MSDLKFFFDSNQSKLVDLTLFVFLFGRSYIRVRRLKKEKQIKSINIKFLKQNCRYFSKQQRFSKSKQLYQILKIKNLSRI